MKIVKVEWVDSSAYAGEWMSQHEAEDMGPKHISSIGWVLHEDKAALKLVADCSVDSFNRIILIPKGCIILRKELKEV